MGIETPVIKIEELTKKYGDLVAVKNASLEVLRGEIFGFLGPNGAGKTTTIRALMDQFDIDSGKYSIFGIPNEQITPDLYRRIGYVSGEQYLFSNMKVGEYLDFICELNDIDNSSYNKYVDIFKIDLKKKVKELSSGNKQKLVLTQAFMKEPELMILDEPTNGLDPLLQKEFDKLLAEFVANGGTVFLSSHILSEVEKLCDRVAIIRDGEIVKVASIRELQKSTNLFKVYLRTNDKEKMDQLSQRNSVTTIELSDSGYEFTYDGDPNSLMRVLSDIDIIDISITEPSLEQVFLKFYDKDQDA